MVRDLKPPDAPTNCFCKTTDYVDHTSDVPNQPEWFFCFLSPDVRLGWYSDIEAAKLGHCDQPPNQTRKAIHGA